MIAEKRAYTARLDGDLEKHVIIPFLPFRKNIIILYY